MIIMENVVFLVHNSRDHVGVATVDLEKGTTAQGKYLDVGATLTVEVSEGIPLGHKLSITRISGDQPVIEYGQEIGRAIHEIQPGNHVHTHNIKSMRW